MVRVADEFRAVENFEVRRVGLQSRLRQSFRFGRSGLRENFLALIIEQIGLGMQSGVEGREKIRQRAHAVIIQHVGGARGNQRRDGLRPIARRGGR